MRALVMAIAIFLAQGVGQTPPAAPKVFKDSNLGFQYSPPTGMYDLTDIDRHYMQSKAAAAGTTDTMSILLSLGSGPDDTAPDWHTVAIETYPRGRMHNSSDRDASITFSGWVARGATATEPTEDVTINDVRFVVSAFERREGRVTKYACVYTAVKETQIVALSFSSNSRSVLKEIVKTMKSFQTTTILPIRPY